MNEKVTETFTVRGRPVGYVAGQWGGAFVAVERGYFPVSPTGYWSCSGFFGRNDVTASAKLEVLEKLAEDRDRERADLVKRLKEAAAPQGNSIINYIHASGAYEKAVQDGFFVTDRQRAELWARAYPLLCLVDSDRRFQPQPEPGYVAWTAEHCADALARARELRGILTRLAAGEIPTQFPMRLLGVNSYLALPPKPSGEPKIDLGGFTQEMALEVAGDRPAKLAAPERSTKEKQSPAPDNQMGLFEPVAVATPATNPGQTPARGISP